MRTFITRIDNVRFHPPRHKGWRTPGSRAAWSLSGTNINPFMTWEWLQVSRYPQLEVLSSQFRRPRTSPLVYQSCQFQLFPSYLEYPGRQRPYNIIIQRIINRYWSIIHCFNVHAQSSGPTCRTRNVCRPDDALICRWWNCQTSTLSSHCRKKNRLRLKSVILYILCTCNVHVLTTVICWCWAHC